MIGKATDSILRAGAIGTLENASTYGRTIPLIYGTVRSPVLAIWAENLRQGNSTKKQKKKDIKTYVENIDFLFGHNPLGGPLQFWDNANTFYPLIFRKYTHTIDFHSWGSVTVPDAAFYAVVAVTQTVTFSETFNDYGGQGSNSVSGSYEVPLWNAAFNGPDSMNSSAWQNYPYAYFWLPGTGPLITFPFYGFADGPTINVYYAAKDPTATSYAASNVGSAGYTGVPITALRLTWEPELGDGSEYSPSWSSQQIIYPFFAGAGSPDIDLGATGAIPNINGEIWGSFPVYADPTLATAGGDADFADMIVDIFNSGPVQGGIGGTLGITAVQHGLNCNDFPGIVQRVYFYNNNDLSGANPIPLPVTAGDFLIAAYTNNAGSAPSGISDTLGNTWTSQLAANPASGTYAYVWTCQVAASGVTAITIAGANGTLQQLGVVEVAGFDTMESVTTSSGTSATAAITNASTTPRTYPGLIVNWYAVAGGYSQQFVDSTNPRWQNVMGFIGTGVPGYFVQRKVWAPGSYIDTHPLGLTWPWDAVSFAFKNTEVPQYPLSLGNILEPTTLANARLGARAGGLWGSININSASKASEILANLYASMNAAPVWSGFQLKSVAWSEVSAAANGAVFVAPTASGPIAMLGPADFIGDESNPPGSVDRTAEVDAPPILSIQHFDRGNNYNQTLTTMPDPAGVTLFGVRKASPMKRDEIVDPQIARRLLGIATRRQVYIRNLYKYKVNADWKLLEPMDLVLLSDPQAGFQNLPVRITSVAEDDKFNLDMEFEPFVYGVHSPVPVTVTGNTPYRPVYGGSPGNVNTPIIFEAVSRLGQVGNQEELWIVLSSPDPSYGGAFVYISTDGGVSYQTQQGWIANGNGTTGYTVGDWPAHADPDTVNDLAVDLTESVGALADFSVPQEDAFQSIFWVAGGTSYIPYELGAYATATLTAANKYALLAAGTGNHLRRSVFAAPLVGVGVDHPNASRFAFLGATALNNPPGIVKIPVDPAWIGTTIYLKFPSFNTFGAGVQSLTGLTAYPFTITGVPGGVNPYGIGPTLFTVNGT